MITKEVADLAAKKATGLLVEDVCLGLGYTAVKLSNGECGACFTFRGELGPKCGVISEAGKLIGKPAEELIEKCMSTSLAESSLAVATINAVLNADFCEGENAMNVMDIRENDTIGLIGYFMPVVKQFQSVAKNMYIFERNLTDEGLMPDWTEDIYLPECDVVVITGVTFINKTIDHILDLSKNAKEIIIMGASTCMAPDILKKHGVTVLAGGKITDPEKLMKVVAQGGGGLDVQKYTQNLCVRLAERRN